MYGAREQKPESKKAPSSSEDLPMGTAGVRGCSKEYICGCMTSRVHPGADHAVTTQFSLHVGLLPTPPHPCSLLSPLLSTYPLASFCFSLSLQFTKRAAHQLPPWLGPQEGPRSGPEKRHSCKSAGPSRSSGNLVPWGGDGP